MTRVTDVKHADVEIADGKITVMADGAAALYVATPDPQPLGREQRHATLRIVGDEYHVVADLDAEGLDALADAISHTQTEHPEGDDDARS